MPKSKVAIAYTINQNSFYWRMLYQSVLSIRRHSKTIPILVFVYGKSPWLKKLNFKALNVQFIQKPKVVAENAWSLKWFSLGEIDFDSVLMCDVDTYFYCDPKLIFKKHQKKDFYARKELGMGQKETHGPLKIADRLNSAKYQSLCKEIGAKNMPIFNAGFMLFNRRSHSKWAEHTLLFMSLVHKIRNHSKYASVVKRHFFADEIAGALCLGKVKSLSWDFMNPRLFPFYSEQRFNLVRGSALAVHYNTSHSHQFIESNPWMGINTKEWKRWMTIAKVKIIDLPNADAKKGPIKC